MKDVTVREILSACKGTLLSGSMDTPIVHMSYDSRIIQKQTIFVPIIGEKADGHDFIDSALEKGADAVFTSRHTKKDIEALSEDRRKKAWIAVEDTRAAMQATAAFYRNRFQMPIIGVTGSVGKTTTRAMIAEALSAGRNVYQTKGNQNSQVGVPLMLTEADGEEIAVLEMGMSEFGEMDRLTNMVRPEVAVITCIGAAHIENLGSKENILKEKLAIVHGMDEKGILLLNGDDEMLLSLKESLRVQTYYYGTGEQCDFRAENIRLAGGRAEFEAVLPEARVNLSLLMPGMHNVQNAMAAMAVCSLFHIPLEKAAEKLSAFRGVKMRQQIYRLSSCTVIDDSYNANPDSMKAALRVLMELPGEGRKVAVLGDMLELGDEEVHYHEEIGVFAARTGVDTLITIGGLAKHMNEAAEGYEMEKQRACKKNGYGECGIETFHFFTNQDIIAFLKEFIKQEDTVLIKGSRGMALNEIADALVSG